MFRINPSKTYRVDNAMPNKPVKASVRTKPITTSQPHVISQENVNSNSNGVSSTGVESIAKTKRPQPRSNIKNDRVSSVSKSSYIKNKDVEVEEHHRNLLLSKNKKHMSSECNNVKLAIRNDTSEVVCAMFKQCLITANQDVCRSNLFMVHRLGLPKAYDRKSKASHKFHLEVSGNWFGAQPVLGNRTTNLYTINLHEMASASPICLIARATSTKSWLWHQRLYHLNFDTINDLTKNDLVIRLPKFKYHKEHLCTSCEQGKRKKASHKPKPVPNSKQRSKDEAPEEIKTFLKKITVLLQAPVIINGVVERRNRTLIEAARTMLIFSSAPLFLCAKAIANACYTQNRSIIHRRLDKTPYELINGEKLDISFLNVFGALCYPKNDREDIDKLGVKGDIGFFIGFSATSCAYRVYNRMTKKITETMNVTFDELSAMAFEQRSSKPRLQGMTYGQIISGFDLTYAPSTITSQKPTEPPRTALAAPTNQNLPTQNVSTTVEESAPTPTNSSSQSPNIPNTSHDVDELPQQQYV
ncbi:retrovirus-related pol polyprotein from transposon TNT 1-94 [Tanacetum coccineum]